MIEVAGLDPDARPRGRAPWTLRRRIVIAIVALLAIVGVAVGGISVAALHQNLLGRLDEQVRAGLGFSGPNVQPGNGDPDDPGYGPGRRVGTLVLTANGGTVLRAEYTDDDGTILQLTVKQAATLLALDVADDPVSVDLGGDLGAFRVAGRSQSGATLISGLSLDDVNTTTRNLALIFGAVLLAALVVAAFAGAWIARVALRPLDRVAATAIRVSERPLAQGEVSMPERVPAADSDPRTEVGQVGASLNRLLGHVEGALVSREESEQTLRRFIADASHELRTPLASIRGYAELSQRVEQNLPPDVQRAV